MNCDNSWVETCTRLELPPLFCFAFAFGISVRAYGGEASYGEKMEETSSAVLFTEMGVPGAEGLLHSLDKLCGIRQ